MIVPSTKEADNKREPGRTLIDLYEQLDGGLYEGVGWWKEDERGGSCSFPFNHVEQLSKTDKRQMKRRRVMA